MEQAIANGAPQASAISLVPVGLKEAALDSPSFRATSLHFAEQVEAVEKWLENFVRSITKITPEVAMIENLFNAHINTIVPPTSLSEAILDHDYTLLAAQRYNDLAKGFWNAAIAGMKKLDSNMVGPVRHFLNHELKNFKELRRQLDFTQRTYDNLQARYSAQTRTKDPSSLREDAFQLHEARKAYLKSSLDFSVATPQFRLALDKVLVVIFSGQSNTIIKGLDNNQTSKWASELERVRGWSREMESGEKTFRRELHDARVRIEENAEVIARPSRELEDYSNAGATPLITQGPISSIPTSKPKSAEKQGWLNLKTTPSKQARPVWVRRWFYVKNGIFGWLVQGSRSGGVEESDKIGVLLCGVRAATSEERRFCFEVKTKDRTVSVQAESHAEMVEWMSSFDLAKQKALHEPESTDHFSDPNGKSIDPAFAITPPSAPEFAASAADAGLHTEDATDPKGSLGIPHADTPGLVQRGSFDVTQTRRSTTFDREESNREKLKQKLDLSRRSTGLSGSNPQAGVASLISASYTTMPVAPGLIQPDQVQSPVMGVSGASRAALLARKLPPSTLAPSTLANPPAPTNLSATAVLVNGERGVGIGSADATGGMPSGMLGNLWGSTNWGYINQFERGEVRKDSDEYDRKVAAQKPPAPTPPPKTDSLNVGTPDGLPAHRKTVSINGDEAELHRAPEKVADPADFPANYPMQLKRQDAQFRLLFPNVKKHEKLVLVFRATWNPNDRQEFPGRVYITPANMYFYSHHLGLVLVSKMSLMRVSEVTAAPGRDCDFVFMHLKGYQDSSDSGRITVKTFLDSYRLLQLRLNYLVNNCNSESPESLEGIMKAMSTIEKDLGNLAVSQEKPAGSSSPVNLYHRDSFSKSSEMRPRVIVDQGLSGVRHAAEKETAKFKLPNKPVVYVPRGMTEAAVERIFNVSPKALFHVMFGDRSVVWQQLYHERRAQHIKQGPWTQEDQNHMRRFFEYEVEYPGLIWNTKHALITDSQIIDVSNDHLCYVVTDKKTPWQLPYFDQFSLVSKIVITHVAKSRCKLAIYTKTEWYRHVFPFGTLVERNARAELQLDALDLADVIAEQVRKLGPQGQTKKAMRVFGAVGQHGKVVEFVGAAAPGADPAVPASTSAAGPVQMRRRRGRRSVARLLAATVLTALETVLATLVGGALGVGAWLWKTVSASKLILLLLAASVAANLLLTSREAAAFWRERRAGAYMARLGLGPDVRVSKSLSVRELEAAVLAGVDPDAPFRMVVAANNGTGGAAEDEPCVAAFDASASRESLELRANREQLGRYRHDLAVGMRVVNAIERELVVAGWEGWVAAERARCDRMGRVLEGYDDEEEADAVKEQMESYCDSCRKFEVSI